MYSSVMNGYLVFISIINISFGVSINGKQKDYCNSEDFNPTCPSDEVIFIQEATFGLMKLGRCNEVDTGFIGCSADVVGFLDSKCSGASSCNIGISDNDIKAQVREICPEAYLEASYSCQKVITVSGQNCAPIKVRQGPAYIASVISAETSCGYGNNPWILQAQQGQQINLTLIDFAWKSRDSWRQKCQSVYGHVLDMNNQVKDICGSSKRETSILTSSTHEVHLVLKEVQVQDTRFLIKFEAIGCPDIVPPTNAWLRKDDNDITVGCHTSSDKWQLKCVGNHWIGVIGNCTQATPVKQRVIQEQEFGGQHIAAFAIGCAAIVICCVTVTIGIYFVKRYKISLKSKHGMPVPQDHEMYLIPQQSTRGSVMLQPNLHDRQNTNNQTLNSRNGNSFFSPNQTLNPSHQNDNDSVKYFVLERPPGYSDNHIS